MDNTVENARKAFYEAHKCPNCKDMKFILIVRKVNGIDYDFAQPCFCNATHYENWKNRVGVWSKNIQPV